MHPNRNAAAGFVLHDASGQSIIAMAKKLGTMEILVAEAIALREGLFAIPNPSTQHLTVEGLGDSKLLIDVINGKIATPWKIKFFVLDILFLSRRFASISFYHIYWEANFLADSLALLGHSASPSLLWFNELPLSSCSAFQFNLFGGGKMVVQEAFLCSCTFISLSKKKYFKLIRK